MLAVLLLAVTSALPTPRARPASQEDGQARYAEIFRAHYGRVVRWLSVLGVGTADVDDAAQEVFIIAHRRIDQLRPDATVTGWLLGISRRVAATSRRNRERARVRQARANPPQEPIDPETKVMREEAALVLQRFLDGLPEPQRVVFALYELDGMNATEVGALMDISTNTVHSRVRLIREKLNRVVARERSKRTTTHD